MEHFQNLANSAYNLIRERQVVADRQADGGCTSVNSFRPYGLEDISFVVLNLAFGWSMAAIGFVAERVCWSLGIYRQTTQ